MKQQITKKQWDELSKKQQKVWVLFFVGKWQTMCDVDNADFTELMYNTPCESAWLEPPNIGQMIEFLDTGLLDSFLKSTRWQVILELKQGECKDFKSEELCDALWEAVKYKLNAIR